MKLSGVNAELNLRANGPIKAYTPFCMNARGFRSMTVTVLLLGASIAIMAASATGFQAMRHDLTIAIVDMRRSTPTRESFQLQVAALVRNAVKATFHNDVHVELVIANTADAKAKLNGGEYDAALVLGSDRPFALRRLNLVTLAGTLPADAANEPVSLLVRAGDSNVAARLRETFSRLLSPHRAANQISSDTTALSAIGAKLATIEP